MTKQLKLLHRAISNVQTLVYYQSFDMTSRCILNTYTQSYQHDL
nr:MAG TPA: hypothetical protein [Caudoviricetes sp.]